MSFLRISQIKVGMKLWRWLCLVAIAATLPVSAGPDWWSRTQSPSLFVPGAEADDHAAINQGQLKSFAAAAVAHLDANFPGGAGHEAHALLDGWHHDLVVWQATHPSDTELPSDFDPIVLGQLK